MGFALLRITLGCARVEEAIEAHAIKSPKSGSKRARKIGSPGPEWLFVSGGQNAPTAGTRESP
jgi:hypothetical protein